MDVQKVVAQVQAAVQTALADPLTVPLAGSLAGLALCIGLLYWCAAAGERQQKQEAGGTVFEHGVRRSTRAHKQPEHFVPDSATPGKTPRATRTPTATKEAETVTPKPSRARPSRAAAAKTPATVEPMTTRTRRTAAAKTPAK